MTDINNVTLTGRLAGDMELRYTTEGVPVGKFGLAVNGSVRNGDRWEDRAYFFDVSVWGKRAESLAAYMTKGRQVAVYGKLRQERWTDRETGAGRSRVSVLADGVSLFGAAPGTGEKSPGSGAKPSCPSDEGMGQGNDLFPDDIPF